MAFPTTHEEFMQSVQNHLKEREGCPIILIVNSPQGLEMQINFMDFALQAGILSIAKKTTKEAFKRQLKEGFRTGKNQIMASNIKDISDPNKKKVN